MTLKDAGKGAHKASPRLMAKLSAKKEELKAQERAKLRLRREEGQFILMNDNAFKDWLINESNVTRAIKRIQNHHTWKPRYENTDNQDHFKIMAGMKRSHKKRGFSDIAQNLTTFPDGYICVGRPLNTIPAGIKGANSGGICIEHVGNFDLDGDTMTQEHKELIVWLNATLLDFFNLETNTDSIVYHHWWTASGKRTNGIKSAKSCPGTNFFGGNKVEDCENNLLPLINEIRNAV